ncbi:MAG: DNA/RNA nuclease SfsA [Elusimicrobia bacterium]|nr:DNA/RNA nuclease SfsA [Candidatus Liberimonas magnetica]
MDRPNRFVMMVDVNGRIERCFCPCPTKIGNLIFESIPCLLSNSNSSNTKYTVEAISLSPVDVTRKKWIGINQTKINSYIEHLFLAGELNKVVKRIKSVKREYGLSNSKIDFLVNTCLVEVKTPLTNLPYKSYLKYQPDKAFHSYHRTIKHYNLLSKHIGEFSRAIVLHCFMYNAEKYRDLFNNITKKRMRNIVKKAIFNGVENWQVNLKIGPKGVSLIDCYKLNNICNGI